MAGKQRNCKRKSWIERKSHGQAVVEFALVMVFFLLILLAVLDIGRAYLTSVALENAAAEGALYGSANPACVDSIAPGCGDPNNVVYRAKHESVGGLLNPDEMEVAVSPDPEIGGELVVTVTYQFRPIIPLVSAFGAEVIPLSRSAKQLIP